MDGLQWRLLFLCHLIGPRVIQFWPFLSCFVFVFRFSFSLFSLFSFFFWSPRLGSSCFGFSGNNSHTDAASFLSTLFHFVTFGGSPLSGYTAARMMGLAMSWNLDDSDFMKYYYEIAIWPA